MLLDGSYFDFITNKSGLSEMALITLTIHSLMSRFWFSHVCLHLYYHNAALVHKYPSHMAQGIPLQPCYLISAEGILHML